MEGYVDDVEFALADGVANMRTSSRLGYLDLGVNAKRFNVTGPATHARFCAQSIGTRRLPCSRSVRRAGRPATSALTRVCVRVRVPREVRSGLPHVSARSMGGLLVRLPPKAMKSTLPKPYSRQRRVIDARGKLRSTLYATAEPGEQESEGDAVHARCWNAEGSAASVCYCMAVSVVDRTN